MQIQVNTDHNIEGREALVARVRGIVESALSRVVHGMPHEQSELITNAVPVTTAARRPHLRLHGDGPTADTRAIERWDNEGGETTFTGSVDRPGLNRVAHLEPESHMPIQLNEEDGGTMLVVHVSGRLDAADYETFVPAFERLVREHGRLRVLFDMTGFHGWTAGALWQDTKFAMHHFHDIDRLAVVGEKAWQEGMATFCKPFTAATIRYFDHDDASAARRWLGDASQGSDQLK